MSKGASAPSSSVVEVLFICPITRGGGIQHDRATGLVVIRNVVLIHFG